MGPEGPSVQVRPQAAEYACSDIYMQRYEGGRLNLVVLVLIALVVLKLTPMLRALFKKSIPECFS